MDQLQQLKDGTVNATASSNEAQGTEKTAVDSLNLSNPTSPNPEPDAKAKLQKRKSFTHGIAKKYNHLTKTISAGIPGFTKQKAGEEPIPADETFSASPSPSEIINHTLSPTTQADSAQKIPDFSGAVGDKQEEEHKADTDLSSSVNSAPSLAVSNKIVTSTEIINGAVVNAANSEETLLQKKSRAKMAWITIGRLITTGSTLKQKNIAKDEPNTDGAPSSSSVPPESTDKTLVPSELNASAATIASTAVVEAKEEEHKAADVDPLPPKAEFIIIKALTWEEANQKKNLADKLSAEQGKTTGFAILKLHDPISNQTTFKIKSNEKFTEEERNIFITAREKIRLQQQAAEQPKLENPGSGSDVKGEPQTAAQQPKPENPDSGSDVKDKPQTAAQQPKLENPDSGSGVKDELQTAAQQPKLENPGSGSGVKGEPQTAAQQPKPENQNTLQNPGSGNDSKGEPQTATENPLKKLPATESNANEKVFMLEPPITHQDKFTVSSYFTLQALNAFVTDRRTILIALAMFIIAVGVLVALTYGPAACPLIAAWLAPLTAGAVAGIITATSTVAATSGVILGAAIYSRFFGSKPSPKESTVIDNDIEAGNSGTINLPASASSMGTSGTPSK